MLIPPVQNQDFTQRGDAVSDLRNAESGKVQGLADHQLAKVKEADEKLSSQVDQTEELAADPDGGERDKKQRKRRSKVPNPHSELRDPSTQERTDGGHFIDLQA